MKRYFNKIHYEKCDNFVDERKNFVYEILLPFSFLYSILVNIRNFFYEQEWMKKSRLDAYVISVGNLTTGGTGKTPITTQIANYIREKYHKKVAILSRGYGGQLSVKGINIVSDGKNILSTAYLAGDEPYWIAANSREIPVITGKNRVKTGQYAIDNFDSEVIVLDDCFGYVKLERNLNILVIDCKKRFGNNMVLPAGPLREPLSQIKRADIIVVVNKQPFDNSTSSKCNDFIETIKDKYNKPTYLCNFQSGEIYNIKTSEKLDPCIKDVYAFAAIAQPEFFFNYLKEQGLNLVTTREFSDHHFYTNDDIQNIINEAQKLGVRAIITTEKDAVKLLNIIHEVEIPIYALNLEINLDLDSIISL